MPALALDLPEPISRYILGIRRRFHSWRAAIPAEITVAGSSGLGELHFAAADAEEALRVLQTIARTTRPIRTRLATVDCFPGTSIYHFTVVNSEPFFEFQEALSASGLQFAPSPFPFTPHCTLIDERSASAIAVAELRSLAPPPQEFTLRVLSLYELGERVLIGDPTGCTRLVSLRLAG